MKSQINNRIHPHQIDPEAFGFLPLPRTSLPLAGGLGTGGQMRPVGGHHQDRTPRIPSDFLDPLLDLFPVGDPGLRPCGLKGLFQAVVADRLTGQLLKKIFPPLQSHFGG